MSVFMHLQCIADVLTKNKHLYVKSYKFTLIKLKLRSFKSSEHINEKGDGPYRGFDY